MSLLNPLINDNWWQCLVQDKHFYGFKGGEV
jgi:hypothetical protein